MGGGDRGWGEKGREVGEEKNKTTTKTVGLCLYIPFTLYTSAADCLYRMLK